jgi:hypothetical protein
MGVLDGCQRPNRHKEAARAASRPAWLLAACPLVISAPRVHTARHVRTVFVDPRPPAESALPRRDYFQVRVLAAWPLSRLHEQTRFRAEVFRLPVLRWPLSRNAYRSGFDATARQAAFYRVRRRDCCASPFAPSVHVIPRLQGYAEARKGTPACRQMDRGRFIVPALWQSNGTIRVVLRKPLIVLSGYASKCLPCNAR